MKRSTLIGAVIAVIVAVVVISGAQDTYTEYQKRATAEATAAKRLQGLKDTRAAAVADARAKLAAGKAEEAAKALAYHRSLNDPEVEALAKQIRPAVIAEQAANVEKARRGKLDEAEALFKRGDAQAAADLISTMVLNGDKEASALNARLLPALAKERAQTAAWEKAAKKRGGVRIGMTQQDVIDSSWGKPMKVNRTTYSFGVHEQWVYGGGYLYFENGVLKTIQN